MKTSVFNIFFLVTQWGNNYLLLLDFLWNNDINPSVEILYFKFP